MLLAALLAGVAAPITPAFAQSEPCKVFDTKPVITQGPYLVATSSDTATVVWFTDTQVARVDATASELTVVVSGTDGKVVQTVTIPRR